MSEAIRCHYCGANLGPADLDQPACPYCKTVHPHVAQARRQSEALRQVFAQGGMPGMMGVMPPPGAAGQPGAPSPWQQQPMGMPLAPPGPLPMPPRRAAAGWLPLVIGLLMVMAGVVAAALVLGL